MSVEENQKLIASFVKAVDDKDWDRVRDCFEEEAAIYLSHPEGAALGADDMIEGWKAEAETYPDARRDIVHGFGQDDWVCIEVRETGTHMGPLAHGGKTYPPTGKKFRIGACAMFRVHGGKIAEARIYHDPRQHLVQLGIP